MSLLSSSSFAQISLIEVFEVSLVSLATFFSTVFVGKINSCPSQILFTSFILLALAISFTVVPLLLAITERLSPLFTIYLNISGCLDSEAVST